MPKYALRVLLFLSPIILQNMVPICESSSLVQMQLQNVKSVALVLDIDETLGVEGKFLEKRLKEILVKGNVATEGSGGVLKIVAREDKASFAPGISALYVSIRFEDGIVLKRAPELEMGNFPTIIWQKDFVKIVRSEMAAHTLEKIASDSVQLFSDDVNLATRIAGGEAY